MDFPQPLQKFPAIVTSLIQIPVIDRDEAMRAYLVFEIINDPARYARARQFVLDGLAAGRFRPHIDRTFPFDDIVAAHRYLEANAQVGKIVVTVGG